MFINHVLSYPLRDGEYIVNQLLYQLRIVNQLLYQLRIESISLYSLYLASLHHVVGRCDLYFHACFNYLRTRMHVDVHSLKIICLARRLRERVTLFILYHYGILGMHVDVYSLTITYVSHDACFDFWEFRSDTGWIAWLSHELVCMYISLVCMYTLSRTSVHAHSCFFIFENAVVILDE